MTCGYCGSRIGEGEHRCRRCGRRPGDTLAPEIAVHRTDGALAAQVRVAPVQTLPQVAVMNPEDLARATQRPLFAAGNVIPIQSYAPPKAPAPRKPRADTAARQGGKPMRRPRVSENQTSLDFLPALPAKPRTLGTTVEAVIYCDAAVAMRLHRAVAAAIDWSLALIACGLFFVVFLLCGGEIYLSRATSPVYALAMGLVGFTYGLTFALAGTETPGQRWTRLRLMTFDGFSPDLRQRLTRFGAACLSVCTVFGMLWPLGDEENLSWQDHISRTFLTPRAAESQILQRK